VPDASGYRRVARGSVAAAEPIDLAAFAFGGAPRSTVTLCDHGRGIPGWGAVLHGLSDEGSTHPFGDGSAYHQDAIEAGDPHAQLIPGTDRLRGLRAFTVDAYMPRAACGGRGGARLVDADGPQPRIDAGGVRHTAGSVLAAAVARRVLATTPAAMSP